MLFLHRQWLYLPHILLFMAGIRVYKERDGFPVEMIQCGEEKCTPGHEFGGMRSYYLMHIIQEGEGEFYSRGQRWSLKKGDVFFIFPEIQNQYKADIKNPWSYFWLAFDGDYKAIFNAINLSPDSPILHSNNVEFLYEKYRSIYKKSETWHPGDFLEISANLKLLLSSLFKERNLVKESMNPINDIKAEHVKSMYNFICTYFNTPIKVSDVVDYVSLERTYASKLFKNAMGNSIGGILKKTRLDQADIYLKEGWSAKETAYSVGYQNYENFLKNFKKSRGMTPGKFKLS